MRIGVWIVSGGLALLYLVAGAGKIVVPHERLARAPRMAWAADLPRYVVKGIGLVEVLAAAALILPWARGVALVLTQLAAISLVALQAGGFAIHSRRGKYRDLPLNVVSAAAGLAALARPRAGV